jgi:hypothetical protein
MSARAATVSTVAGPAGLTAPHAGRLRSAGAGLAIVPESAAALHPDGAAFITLVDTQSPPVELAATWHEGAGNPALTGRCLFYLA